MKKKHVRELKLITEQVTQKYKDRITREQYVAPTVRKAVDIAMQHESISEEQKERLRNLKEAGVFDKKETVVNQSVQKKIDKELNEAIARAVVAGRLPAPKNNALLDKYIKKCKQNTQ